MSFEIVCGGTTALERQEAKLRLNGLEKQGYKFAGMASAHDETLKMQYCILMYREVDIGD